jgi:hypothetical protein
MKLNFKAAFDAILRFGNPTEPPAENQGDDPVSIVLLLREPQFLTLEQLRSAGERAFEVPFSDDKESQHFVMQAVLFTLMKTGPHTLSFLNYRQPYGASEFPPDFAMSFPKASQREAWRTHTAWTAVDYVKGGKDLEVEYGVLGQLCAEMVDANCLALYAPGEGILFPNDGSLPQKLKREWGPN